MNSAMDTWLVPGGFSHSEIAGSKVVCHLTDTYRRLPRLSSPLTAKASAVCACSLDHITPKHLYTDPKEPYKQGTDFISPKIRA